MSRVVYRCIGLGVMIIESVGHMEEDRDMMAVEAMDSIRHVIRPGELCEAIQDPQHRTRIFAMINSGFPPDRKSLSLINSDEWDSLIGVVVNSGSAEFCRRVSELVSARSVNEFTSN